MLPCISGHVELSLPCIALLYLCVHDVTQQARKRVKFQRRPSKYMPSHSRQQSTAQVPTTIFMVIQNPHSQPFSYSFFITSSWRDDTFKHNSEVWLSYQDLHTQKWTFPDISNIRMWLFSFFQSNFCVENKQTAESKYPFKNCLVAWVDVTKHFYQKCRQFLSKLFIPASKLKHSVNVGTRHVNSFLLFFALVGSAVWSDFLHKGGIGLVDPYHYLSPSWQLDRKNRSYTCMNSI